MLVPVPIDPLPIVPVVDVPVPDIPVPIVPVVPPVASGVMVPVELPVDIDPSVLVPGMDVDIDPLVLVPVVERVRERPRVVFDPVVDWPDVDIVEPVPIDPDAEVPEPMEPDPIEPDPPVVCAIAKVGNIIAAAAIESAIRIVFSCSSATVTIE